MNKDMGKVSKLASEFQAVEFFELEKKIRDQMAEGKFIEDKHIKSLKFCFNSRIPFINGSKSKKIRGQKSGTDNLDKAEGVLYDYSSNFS